MDIPDSTNPNDLDIQFTNATTSYPPTAPSVSMLDHANNIGIKDSTFSITTNNYSTYSDSSASLPLSLLHKFAAPNAILNSGGRADEVRCHPGTREEVIDLVEKAISAQGDTGPQILWLSGPAGAGKTAIMQTVAERCEEGGVPHANFFFFRADRSRCDASALVATLMYQIIDLYPSMGPAVATVLASHPLLFQMGLQKQFDALLHQTFPTVHDSSSDLRPLVLLIDGLDECDSETKTAQRQLLQALDALLLQKGRHFRVVVASRVEPQISMAFKQLRSHVDSIFLDEQYAPEKDIRLFVTAEFDKIKSTHYLADTLGQDWPASSDVDGIVSKSSGQFIYAATVMRFIAHSPASPILSLQKAQGVVPPAKSTPFAYLDAVYTYILEQADDREAVKDVLAFRFHSEKLTVIIPCLQAYQKRYTGALVLSCISELTPILDKRDHRLLFFHASFSDFLLDKSRAGKYHIDLEMFCATVFPSLWAAGKEINAHTFNIWALTQILQRPDPKITIALMNHFPDLHNQRDWQKSELRELVKSIYRIYAPHDHQAFIQIMCKWAAFNKKLIELFPPHILLQTNFVGYSQMLASSRRGDRMLERAMKLFEKGLRYITGEGETED